MDVNITEPVRYRGHPGPLDERYKAGGGRVSKKRAVKLALPKSIYHTPLKCTPLWYGILPAAGTAPTHHKFVPWRQLPAVSAILTPKFCTNFSVFWGGVSVDFSKIFVIALPWKLWNKKL